MYDTWQRFELAPTKHMSEVTPLNKVEYTFDVFVVLQFSTEDP